MASSSNTFLQFLLTQLKCSVCLQPFNNPKLLSCSHSFCYDCCHLVNGTITCALCREVTIINNKDDLPNYLDMGKQEQTIPTTTQHQQLPYTTYSTLKSSLEEPFSPTISPRPGYSTPTSTSTPTQPQLGGLPNTESPTYETALQPTFYNKPPQTTTSSHMGLNLHLNLDKLKHNSNQSTSPRTVYPTNQQGYSTTSPPTTSPRPTYTTPAYVTPPTTPTAATTAANNPNKRQLNNNNLIEQQPYTPDELARGNGENNGPILIAIKGKVYDVSRGRQSYGPGGPYNVFAGHDATVALAKGTLDPNDCDRDDSELNQNERAALNEWISVFDSKYDCVGWLESDLKERKAYKKYRV